ncbi:XRE family transcriptional regulator [Mesorhizobium sp. M0006]|uniref:helix-turn-helix domain-containing protein n=1 Tax=Mesorhizobium sp. M0006 TaxID=2956838 RepID=UPI00333A61EF
MTSANLQIRHYRTLQKISLRDLAKRLEMSPSQLSKIESGKAKLNVETAIKIAGVLKVPAAVFLTERAPLPKARRSITKKGAADIYENPGMRMEVLCSEFKEKQNLFWKVRITARSFEENGGWRQHPGQEFLHILSGHLELHTMYYEPLALDEGDSILFDADQPHAYVALGGDAEMLMMNSVAENA